MGFFSSVGKSLKKVYNEVSRPVTTDLDKTLGTAAVGAATYFGGPQAGMAVNGAIGGNTYMSDLADEFGLGGIVPGIGTMEMPEEEIVNVAPATMPTRPRQPISTSMKTPSKNVVNLKGEQNLTVPPVQQYGVQKPLNKGLLIGGGIGAILIVGLIAFLIGKK